MQFLRIVPFDHFLYEKVREPVFENPSSGGSKNMSKCPVRRPRFEHGTYP
jgi:hypothetical protein